MNKSIRLVVFVLALALILASCHRRPVSVSVKFFTPAPPGTHAATASPVPRSLPEFAVAAVATEEGTATWYNVPDQSLPERRAWSGEMTAASDTLPLNTYVRVRRIGPGDNGKSVVVRITDRGLHRKGTLIDLDREAAETLDLLQKGTARVRVETLALKHANADKPVDKKDEAPTAAKITATPAATKEQEKDNAAAKAGGATPP